MYLKRDHAIQLSRSGVWRTLKGMEMNRVPSSQRFKRHGFEERGEMELKGVAASLLLSPA